MTDKEKLDEIQNLLRGTIELLQTAPPKEKVPVSETVALFVAMQLDIEELRKK